MKKEKKRNLSPLTIFLLVVIFLMGAWMIRQIIKNNNEAIINQEQSVFNTDQGKTEQQTEYIKQQEIEEEEKRLEYLNCIIEFMKETNAQSASEERTLYDMAKDFCRLNTGYEE